MATETAAARSRRRPKSPPPPIDPTDGHVHQDNMAELQRIARILDGHTVVQDGHAHVLESHETRIIQVDERVEAYSRRFATVDGRLADHDDRLSQQEGTSEDHHRLLGQHGHAVAEAIRLTGLAASAATDANTAVAATNATVATLATEHDARIMCVEDQVVVIVQSNNRGNRRTRVAYAVGLVGGALMSLVFGPGLYRTVTGVGWSPWLALLIALVLPIAIVMGLTLLIIGFPRNEREPDAAQPTQPRQSRLSRIRGWFQRRGNPPPANQPPADPPTQQLPAQP